MSSSEDDTTGATNQPFNQEPLLRKRLLACPYFKDRENRLILIGGLDWSIDDNPNEQTHTTLIIRSCLNHRLGLQNLIYLLRSYEGSSKSMGKLDECMKQLFPGVTTYEQLDALKEIFNKNPKFGTILEKAYNAAKGLPQNSAQAASITSERISSILEEYADAVQHSDESAPRLIEFVKKIADETTEQNLSNALLPLINRIVKEQGITWNTENSSKIQDTVRIEEAAFVQIAFIPTSSTVRQPSKSYTIQAWLWSRRDKQESFLSKKTDFQWNLTQVAPVLRDILNDAEAQLASHQIKPIVELFLPDELLAANLRKWKIRVSSTSKAEQSFCVAYPVVVRSLERSRQHDPGVVNNWKRYWNRLKDTKKLQISFIQESIYNQWKTENLYDGIQSLLEHGLIPFFTFIPTSLSSRNRKTFLEAISMTGTPTAFWFQPNSSNLSEASLAKTCEDLLAGQEFLNLPHILWQERVKAIRETNLNHFTHYLTALWDDPYRIPKDLKGFGLPQTNINGMIATEDLSTGK